MRRAWGPWLLAAALVASCSTDRCKSGSVLLTLTFTGGTERADALDVTLAVDGGTPRLKSVKHPAGSTSGSIEIDFSGAYPARHMLAFSVTARAGTQVLGRASRTLAADAGCSVVALTVGAAAPDLGVSVDMNGADLSIPPDLTSVAVPQLVAPLSTATVTQQRPTLRWTLSPGGGTVAVDLCADRACTMPLSIPAQVAADGLSAVPMSPLLPGWVYWRVRTSFGTQTATSATWQFWVPPRSASSPVDSSSGSVLDIDGDGYADFFVGSFEKEIVHVFFGGATGLSARRIDLTSPTGAGHGFAVSAVDVGDLNGDGYADFAVGAPTAPGGGVVHLYLGGPNPSAAGWNGAGAAARVDIATLDGTGAQFGSVLGGVGDVDGDGFADMAVGVTSLGLVHLFFGTATPSASGWPANRRVDATAPAGAMSFGQRLAHAGDVDGDGHADFLVGASEAAYLYRGTAMPSPATWNGASPPLRTALTSPSASPVQFAASLAGVGDLNADGQADFVIGAFGTNSNTGAVYVYLGEATINAADWNGGTRRIAIAGNGGQYGETIAGAGDINNDGLADFVVGAPSFSSGGSSGGDVLVLFGATGLSSSTTNWTRVDIPNWNGPGAGTGTTLAGIGDLNGDGASDFVVGAQGAGGTTGAAQLFLGKGGAPSSTWWVGMGASFDAAPAPGQVMNVPNTDGSGSYFGTLLGGMAP